MSQQSEIAKSNTPRRIIASGDSDIATVDITLDPDSSPEKARKSSPIIILSSDESPEKRPNKRAHNLSTELSTADNQKKRKLIEDQAPEASTSNDNNGNDNGHTVNQPSENFENYEDFDAMDDEEYDDSYILANCHEVILNNESPTKSNVVTITSDEDESDDELSTDSDDDSGNGLNRPISNATNSYSFYGVLDVAKKLKQRSILISNNMNKNRENRKNLMEARYRNKPQLTSMSSIMAEQLNENGTESTGADNGTGTSPPDPKVLNQPASKNDNNVDVGDESSQAEVVNEVATEDTADVTMTVDETEEVNPLPVEEIVPQVNIIIQDPETADNGELLVHEGNSQNEDGIEIADNPDPLPSDKDGSEDADNVENEKPEDKEVDMINSTELTEKSNDPQMEVDETANTTQAVFIQNQEPPSSQQENGPLTVHMENIDNLMLTVEDVQNSDVDQLFTKHGGNEVEFKESLQRLVVSNDEETRHLEEQWNKRLHIKHKLNECLERIQRRGEIMKGQIRTKSAATSDEGDKTEPSDSESNKTYGTKLTSASSLKDHHNVTHAVLGKANRIIEESNRRRSQELISFDGSSLYSQSKTSTSSLGKGRQGSIKSVDSIIADHRQKYPYTVPRRGRRIKSNYNDNTGQQHSSIASSSTEPQMSMQQQNTNFPEVSLIRVHQSGINNAIDNRSNKNSSTTSTPSLASSLLHNILSSKPNTTCSPTLARLLTAPERGIQNVKQVTTANNASKFHNNREITITPIAATQNYQDDDDDNSNDRLVIDEGDDDMAKFSRNRDSLMCQGCNKRPASFLCSGCNRQWYCSRQCQVDAWDEHSDVCSG